MSQSSFAALMDDSKKKKKKDKEKDRDDRKDRKVRLIFHGRSTCELY